MALLRSARLLHARTRCLAWLYRICCALVDGTLHGPVEMLASVLHLYRCQPVNKGQYVKRVYAPNEFLPQPLPLSPPPSPPAHIPHITAINILLGRAWL